MKIDDVFLLIRLFLFFLSSLPLTFSFFPFSSFALESGGNRKDRAFLPFLLFIPSFPFPSAVKPEEDVSRFASPFFSLPPPPLLFFFSFFTYISHAATK